jgi:hypothetical protein
VGLYLPISAGFLLIPVVIELGTPWLAAVPEVFHIFAVFAAPDPWHAAHELAEYKACPFNGLMAAKAVCAPVNAANAIARWLTKDKAWELKNLGSLDVVATGLE